MEGCLAIAFERVRFCAPARSIENYPAARDPILDTFEEDQPCGQRPCSGMGGPDLYYGQTAGVGLLAGCAR